MPVVMERVVATAAGTEGKHNVRSFYIALQ